MRLVNALFALAIAVAGLAQPTAQPTQLTADNAGVSMTMNPASSGVLKPGEDLTLTISIFNGSPTQVEAGTVGAFLNRSVVQSRQKLLDWLNPSKSTPSGNLGTNVGQLATPVIAPGQTQTLTLVVPAASVGLTERSAWGARSIATRLTVAGTAVAQARNAIVWYPSQPIQPTRLAIVAPLTVQPGKSGLLTAEELARYTSPTGELTERLDALANRPVAIGIDPMIIASIRLLGSTAPPSATAWLDRLATVTNETFPLGYADSDPTVVSQAGHASPLQPIGFTIDPALFPSSTAGPTPESSSSATPSPNPSQAPRALPTAEAILHWNYTATGIAWPADASVVAADLTAFKSSGITTTILDATNVNEESSGKATDATRTVDGHRVLVSDGIISSLLTKAATAQSENDWQNAVAELSTTLATVARESPDQSHTLLAGFDRTALPVGQRLGDTLDALRPLPWVAAADLSDLLSAKPTTVSLVTRPQPVDRVAAVSSMLRSEGAVSQFASVLGDPTLITGPRRLELLSLLSQSWSHDAVGWMSHVSAFLDGGATLVDSVKIADSSGINLVADHTSLPVLVSNALNFPVTVYVHVRAQSALLNITEDRVPLTIEPASQKRALIPVQSVANGQVTLEVKLTSSTGVPIGQPTFVNINVVAGWETAATVVIAIILVLIFGFGFWRNITKRRRDAKIVKPGGVSVADPAATSGNPGE